MSSIEVFFDYVRIYSRCVKCGGFFGYLAVYTLVEAMSGVVGKL